MRMEIFNKDFFIMLLRVRLDLIWFECITIEKKSIYTFRLVSHDKAEFANV